MKELNQKLIELLQKAGDDGQILQMIEQEKISYPFSKQSHLMAYLLGSGRITYDDYHKMCQEYQERNQYLGLYDMAPRTFGQTWGEEYVQGLFPEFQKATRETMKEKYPHFDGEFDLWLDGAEPDEINGIRIEVKACRANDNSTKGSLASRAYSHQEARDHKFEYHFQQLKPSCCDVFIWIGVCRDSLLYWVLASDELAGTGKFAPQHRNENTGVAGAGIFEGQVFMTEEDLRPYRVEEETLLTRVREKGRA